MLTISCFFLDAAQDRGAGMNNRRAGSFESFGSFSFYPIKNMTTSEGGMGTTNDQILAEKVRLLVNHWQGEEVSPFDVQVNLRRTDIGAAIGLVQPGRLEYYNEVRIWNASF